MHPMARGWRSTKLHLALITMGLVSAAYGAAGFDHALFGEYCMALIAAAGIFSGSATVEKFVKPHPKVDSPD